MKYPQSKEKKDAQGKYGGAILLNYKSRTILEL